MFSGTENGILRIDPDPFETELPDVLYKINRYLLLPRFDVELENIVPLSMSS